MLIPNRLAHFFNQRGLETQVLFTSATSKPVSAADVGRTVGKVLNTFNQYSEPAFDWGQSINRGTYTYSR